MNISLASIALRKSCFPNNSDFSRDASLFSETSKNTGNNKRATDYHLPLGIYCFKDEATDNKEQKLNAIHF